MTDPTTGDFDVLLAQAGEDWRILQTPLPEFADAAGRRAWAEAYALDLVEAGMIVDDPDDRSLVASQIESAVPLRLGPDALVRYLLYAGISEGCLAVEVGVDLTDHPQSLRELVGEGLPNTATVPFERDGLSGFVSTRLEMLPVDEGSVMSRLVGFAAAAVLRDVAGRRGIPVRARTVGADVVLLVQAQHAFVEIVTDPDLPRELEAVIASIEEALSAQP